MTFNFVMPKNYSSKLNRIKYLHLNKESDTHSNPQFQLPPGLNLKVFNMGEFVARIEDQVRIGSNFRSVFDMTSMCNIRLSFGKGKVVDISQVYVVCSLSCS